MTHDAVARFLRSCRFGRVLPLAPGLIFLAFFLVPVLIDVRTWWVAVLAVVATVLLGGLFLGVAGAAEFGPRGRIGYVVVFAAASIALCWPFAGIYALAMATYVTIAMAWLLPWRMSRLVIPLWSLAVGVIGLALGNWVVVMLAVVAVGVGMSMAFGIRSRDLQAELADAQQRIATLAVAAERERIGRDLHDILGHSLTTVVVKSGLAARLVRTDPVAAAAQMADVEGIARTALADVRATAGGFRQVDLTTELHSARSVLSAAGIACTIDGPAEELPAAVSETFGWVVREGVTNVVRHARAATCTITVDDRSVTVADDGGGVGVGADGLTGTGLSGLRERAAAAGVVVEVRDADPHGTILVASLARAGAEALR